MRYIGGFPGGMNTDWAESAVEARRRCGGGAVPRLAWPQRQRSQRPASAYRAFNECVAPSRDTVP